MAESRLSRKLARLRDMKSEKQPWLQHYQALGEVYDTRKSDFTRRVSQGEFLQDNVFDNTPQFAAHIFASVCNSMLWPDASRTFNIVPVAQLKDAPGVEAYFRAVTAKMHLAMDRAEAALQLALMEHFGEQGIFGTSALVSLEGPEEDPAVPVVYETWGIDTMFISEGRRGIVDTVYIEEKKTVRQIFEEYGVQRKPGDKIAAKVRELYEAGKYDEPVTLLTTIEPKTPEKGKKGYAAMPVGTCHIDVDNRVIMREGGFDEMPAAVARMFKRAGETLGRSCGMVGLPASASLNVLSESILVASEKQLDPPLGLLDDGRLGGATVNTSAGALSVFNTAGRSDGKPPIFPLFTVGEMQSAKDLKEQLIQEVMQSFFLDRLLDLNNKTMMTAYETSIRNRLRGESTGSLFARQIAEVLVPTIKRTFNIMYRKGHFGVVNTGPGAEMRKAWRNLTGKDELVVPEVILKAIDAGLDVYDIEFISPAARFMQAEKLQGMFTVMDGHMAVAAMRPDILDNIDLDKWSRDLYKYGGSPINSLRTLEELKKQRETMAERQNAAMALEAGKGMADIQAKSAQALSARQQMGTR